MMKKSKKRRGVAGDDLFGAGAPEGAAAALDDLFNLDVSNESAPKPSSGPEEDQLRSQETSAKKWTKKKLLKMQKNLVLKK